MAAQFAKDTKFATVVGRKTMGNVLGSTLLDAGSGKRIVLYPRLAIIRDSCILRPRNWSEQLPDACRLTVPNTTAVSVLR